MALVISSKAHKYKPAKELPNTKDNGSRGEIHYSLHPLAGGANQRIDKLSQILEKNCRQNLDDLELNEEKFRSSAPSVPIEGVFLTSTNYRYKFQIAPKSENNRIIDRKKKMESWKSMHPSFDIDDMSMSLFNLEAALYSDEKGYSRHAGVFSKYNLEKHSSVSIRVQANSRSRTALQLLLG